MNRDEGLTPASYSRENTRGGDLRIKRERDFDSSHFPLAKLDKNRISCPSAVSGDPRRKLRLRNLSWIDRSMFTGQDCKPNPFPSEILRLAESLFLEDRGRVTVFNEIVFFFVSRRMTISFERNLIVARTNAPLDSRDVSILVRLSQAI